MIPSLLRERDEDTAFSFLNQLDGGGRLMGLGTERPRGRPPAVVLGGAASSLW